MIAFMIAGMALVTYLTRAPFLLLLRGELPRWLSRWLQFVPIAVFTALVVPPFFAPQGHFELGRGLPIVLFAGLVTWRTKQVFSTIGAGLLVFLLIRLWI